MKTSNQLAKYRESLVKYALKYGVTKTAIKYNTNRQYVYRWKNRYNGTTKSLLNRSHRPNSFPTAHTESEIKLIKSYYRKNKHTGLVMLYVMSWRLMILLMMVLTMRRFNFMNNNKYTRGKARAREYAIQLQADLSESSISYAELAEIQTKLKKLGTQYGLIREFKENGLI